MPVPRAAASFEPLPPDLDLPSLVETTANFEYAVRLSCDVIDSHGMEEFEKLVLLHVIDGGKPLVIEGFQNRLDQWTFSTQWLRDNVGKKHENARDLTKGENLPLSINHYLDNMCMLTNQWTPQNYKIPKQRLYLKDIDCPELWEDKLREHVPPGLFYLSECRGEGLGQGSKHADRDYCRAGDLMSCLPPSMRAENMMCYIGHEGTYTPAHREMCASLGQNIMVEASGAVGEDGKPTKPGSSIWFMTESKDRYLVAEYWLSMLGHDIEVESHFAHINAWAKAPFKVYIVEQKVGDFILVPPLAPHQVWNRGTRTIKAAWNRTTVETLELALSEALPRARMVCRDEQYKNKAIVLFSLNRYSSILKNIEYKKSTTRDHNILRQLQNGNRIKQLQKDFKRLFRMFNGILLSEAFSTGIPEKKIELIPFDGNITCSYCRGNIFNRFLTCKNCVVALEDGGEDTYDICLECYAMGRSCRCISKLSWAEQFPWKDLLGKHGNWRKQLLDIQIERPSKIPIPKAFDDQLASLDTKTLAQVCQEQLRVRPFQDPKEKPELEPEQPTDEEDDGNGDPTRRKHKKKRSEKWLRENVPCHVCQYRHPKWKSAICECGVAYCFGSLFRGFDIMPQTVLEDPYWRCPKCREICNCSPCRKREHNVPYQPSGTILGHDTRKFADPRSIEALVDFSSSNSHWVKKAGDDVSPSESRRMQRRIHEAEHAKSQQPLLDDEDDGIADGETAEATMPDETPYEGVIDPILVQHQNIHEPGNANAGDSRRVAQDALSAMNGLSLLEQDPHSFIAEAQLEGDYFGNEEVTLMHTASNGISYGIATNELDADKSATHGKKGKRVRRRMAYKDKVENEAALFSNDANRLFFQSQTEKTMAEAKKTGRLISARAAVTGETLVVKLRISPNKLEPFGHSKSINPSYDFITREDTQLALVRSDIATLAPDAPPAARKRQRNESDGDFSTGQARKKRNTVRHHSTHSDDTQSQNSRTEEEPEDVNTQPSSFKVSKRRSLPAYLARRRSVEDSDIPKELTDTSRRRTTGQSPVGMQKSATLRSIGQPPVASPRLQVQHDDNNYSSGNGSSSGAEVDDRSAPKVPVAVMRPVPVGKKPASRPCTTDELNRLAKLRALESDASLSDDSSADSEADSFVARAPPASKTRTLPKPQKVFESSFPLAKKSAPATNTAVKRGSGHPPKPSLAAKSISPVARTEDGKAPFRTSILRKSRGGKVKILSERGLKKARK